jgi:hypothetical protein
MAQLMSPVCVCRSLSDKPPSLCFDSDFGTLQFSFLKTKTTVEDGKWRGDCSAVDPCIFDACSLPFNRTYS